MVTYIIDLDHTIFDPGTITWKHLQPLFDVFAAQIESRARRAAKTDFVKLSVSEFIDTYGLNRSFLKQQLAEVNELPPTTLRPFPDYETVKRLSGKKILLTSGITLLQQFKIDNLGIKQDFHEIYINDPLADNPLGKFGFLRNLLDDTAAKGSDFYVVGDNYKEEIVAAKRLGMRAILIDRKAIYSHQLDCEYIRSFEELPV